MTGIFRQTRQALSEEIALTEGIKALKLARGPELLILTHH